MNLSHCNQARLDWLAWFDETAASTTPSMDHCHMVNHEDDELVGQVTVQ